MAIRKLSVEQKAQAYDEAIDKIADAVEAGTIEQGFANWLFPELKESEDERIRKEIINYLEPQGDCCGNKERWIAWLEK